MNDHPRPPGSARREPGGVAIPVKADRIMRSIGRMILLLASLFPVGAGAPQRPVETGAPIERLVILHTNDTHGHPVKFFRYPVPGVGGLPARATLVREIRGQYPNVLLLDAGDINTGRPESNLFNAEPDIEGYNYIGYDAVTLGNHEFDNPRHILMRQMKWANFPFLSANVRTRAGQYLARPYMIKRFGCLKVAVFGLTTKETLVSGNPLYIRDLVFEDEVATARRLVPVLKKQADVIIALVHLGIYRSPDRGSIRLAKRVDGIDLIVDGHSHTRIDSPIVVRNLASGHTTLIVQAWKWGLVVGRVDLWIRNRRVERHAFRNIPVNLKRPITGSHGEKYLFPEGRPVREDPVLLKRLQAYVDRVAPFLKEVIGRAEGTFSLQGLREREGALGDLVADAMRWYPRNYGVDFAVQNGGGIRAGLPAGPVTRGKIYEVLPFDNSVVVLTLKGSDVMDLFDFMAGIPKGKGAFPQVSREVRMRINPRTGRCERVRINGASIDPGRLYRIATNSYLANGGDGYRVFLRAVDRYDASRFQRDVLIDYIRYLGGRIRPEVKGRIRFVPARSGGCRFRRAA